MKEHPDDTELMDGLTWRAGTCVMGHIVDAGPVAEVAHVEQNSGPGWAILICRADLAYQLMLARASAQDPAAHKPSLPVLR